MHREVGLSRTDSARLVEQIIDNMCDALAKGENVKISGFGTFVLRDKGQRIGRNPKTGVEVPIAPRRVLTFRASQMMRDRIVKAG
jgi:integration host factor subunit alpha